MAEVTFYTSAGPVLSNDEWTAPFLAAIALKERGRGSHMAYNEKQADWLLFSGASAGAVDWSDIENRPDLSRTKLYTFQIGAAPATGNTVDETFANGTSFQSDLLIGAHLQIRLGSSGLAPQAGGFSYVPATGTITTSSPVADSNMFILAVFDIDGSDLALQAESGQFITTEDGQNIILG